MTHGCDRVIDGAHSWVVLLEMMAQCLFGSLSGDKNQRHLIYTTLLFYIFNLYKAKMHALHLLCSVQLPT